MNTTTTVPRRALFLLAVLTLVWGTNWPLFVYAVREVSVWTFRGIALPAAGISLLLVAAVRGQSLRIARRHWGVVLAASVFYLMVWNVASTYAAVLIPSGQAAVLGFTMPLWAALLGWLVLHQRLTPRMLLALVLGFVAVLLLMVPSFKAYAQAPLGLALGLLSGFGWAVGTLILKRYPLPDVTATVLTAWQLLLAGIPIALVALWRGWGQWFVPDWTTVALITYIALVPMCIGNLCWFSIVGMLPANVAGLGSILVPMVAMVAGAVVHAEPLGTTQWLAMVFSAASLSLALLKKPGVG